MNPLNEALLRDTIFECSDRYGIDAQIIAAIIETESDGDLYAWRFEPPYRYLWNVKWNAPFRKLTPQEITDDKPPVDFHSNIGSRATEWIGQQASWGPMQLMGAVAREYGFNKNFTELCSVLGVEFGCLHLSKLKKRFFDKFGWEGVVAAYNAGTPRNNDQGWENHQYVEKVISHIQAMNKGIA